MTEERYRLRIARPAVHSLAESLPPKVATAAYAFITGPLLDDPRRVGQPLNPPLGPAWSARRGDYRVVYRIDDDIQFVEVTAVGHRSSLRNLTVTVVSCPSQ